jgi:hypothetical protein
MALEVLAHLLAAAELAHELRVEPGLVDLELRVDEDAVAVEPLDVVALVGEPSPKTWTSSSRMAARWRWW